MSILRMQQCLAAGGYRTRTSIYRLIQEGLWTQPIRISRRAVGWPQSEVEAICRARIAGCSETQIRALVADLHQQRQQMLFAMTV